MNLSTAIEHALINSWYSLDTHTLGRSAYMCNVLKHAGLNHMVQAVQEMVHSIHSSHIKQQALISALYDAGYLDPDLPRIEQFAYTTELYVWWVFDLKRKGL